MSNFQTSGQIPNFRSKLPNFRSNSELPVQIPNFWFKFRTSGQNFRTSGQNFRTSELPVKTSELPNFRSKLPNFRSTSELPVNFQSTSELPVNFRSTQSHTPGTHPHLDTQGGYIGALGTSDDGLNSSGSHYHYEYQKVWVRFPVLTQIIKFTPYSIHCRRGPSDLNKLVPVALFSSGR